MFPYSLQQRETAACFQALFNVTLLRGEAGRFAAISDATQTLRWHWPSPPRWSFCEPIKMCALIISLV